VRGHSIGTLRVDCPRASPQVKTLYVFDDLVLDFIITVTYYYGGLRRGLIPSLADREVPYAKTQPVHHRTHRRRAGGVGGASP